MKHLLSFFLGLLFVCSVAAQPKEPCYIEFRNKGVTLMNKKNYGEAISQFVVALVSCENLPTNNDLALLIQEAKESWVRELQASSEREKKAFMEAVAAKEAAEKAQGEEKTAKETAVRNAEEAYKRGVTAEALRLSLLADVVRNKGEQSDAMLLAWLALQMPENEQHTFAVRAFYEAVRDSFATTPFKANDPVSFQQFMPDGKHILVKSGDHYFSIGIAGESSISALPDNLVKVVPAHTQDLALAWQGGSKNIYLLRSDGSTVAVLTGHTEAIRDAIFRNNDQQIVSCSRDMTVRIWSLEGKQVAVLKHSSPVQEVRDWMGSSALVTRTTEGILSIWNNDMMQEASIGNDSAFVRSMDCVADKAIVALFADGSGKLYDANGAFIRDLGADIKEVQHSSSGLIGVRMGTAAMVFAPSGKSVVNYPYAAAVAGIRVHDDFLMVWGEDHIMRRVSYKGKKIMVYVGHRNHIEAPVFTRDGRFMLTVSRDGTGKLWDDEGNILSEWILGTNAPVLPAFSPDDSKILMVVNGKKTLELSPLPELTLNAMRKEEVLRSPAITALQSRYNIQFMEALEKK